MLHFGTSKECLTRFTAGIIAAASLTLPACAGPGITEALPARDTSAWLQTDTTLYMLNAEWVGWETAIPFSYKNATADTVY